MDMHTALPRAALARTMTLLLGGGQGSRLHELTARLCTPAVPLFATHKGPLRLVDFTMANIVRSGLPRLIAATQYRPEALEVHLERRWAPLFSAGHLAVRNGHSLRGARGYGGTVDAVAANRDLIDDAGCDELLILPADQVCQMDYSALIAAHRASGAMVTTCVVPVPPAAAFEAVDPASDGLISALLDNPSRPTADHDHPGQALVSTNVHVVDWKWLRALLPDQRSDLDFRDLVLQQADAAGGAVIYRLPGLPGQPAPYWREVGTLDGLRQMMLDFVGAAPCHVPVLPGAPFRSSGLSEPGTGAEKMLIDSVVLPGGRVMPGARLQNAIVAPGTLVPGDVVIGEDPEDDARWFRRTAGGTVLVTNAMLAQRAGQALTYLRGPLLRAFDLPSLAC